jgi:hypothetical protein
MYSQTSSLTSAWKASSNRRVRIVRASLQSTSSHNEMNTYSLIVLAIYSQDSILIILKSVCWKQNTIRSMYSYVNLKDA